MALAEFEIMLDFFVSKRWLISFSSRAAKKSALAELEIMSDCFCLETMVTLFLFSGSKKVGSCRIWNCVGLFLSRDDGYFFWLLGQQKSRILLDLKSCRTFSVSKGLLNAGNTWDGISHKYRIQNSLLLSIHLTCFGFFLLFCQGGWQNSGNVRDRIAQELKMRKLLLKALTWSLFLFLYQFWPRKWTKSRYCRYENCNVWSANLIWEIFLNGCNLQCNWLFFSHEGVLLLNSIGLEKKVLKAQAEFSGKYQWQELILQK